MRNINGDDVPKLVEETLYTAVGLGVLGFQRMQVRRQELKKSLTSSLGDARTSLDDVLQTVEERLADLDERFDEAYGASVEPLLPEGAREPARQAVSLAREARHQAFQLVGRSTETP
jgi:hypothetical protein